VVSRLCIVLVWVVGVMVMVSCTGTVTEGGKLIVYCTGVGGGVMVMDNCTGTMTESGK
jgi:hypothetical protein